jgi:hypothetical protein
MFRFAKSENVTQIAFPDLPPFPPYIWGTPQAVISPFLSNVLFAFAAKVSTAAKPAITTFTTLENNPGSWTNSERTQCLGRSEATPCGRKAG